MRFGNPELSGALATAMGLSNPDGIGGAARTRRAPCAAFLSCHFLASEAWWELHKHVDSGWDKLNPEASGALSVTSRRIWLKIGC